MIVAIIGEAASNSTIVKEPIANIKAEITPVSPKRKRRPISLNNLCDENIFKDLISFYLLI